MKQPRSTAQSPELPLPPSIRSRQALRLTGAAAVGRFELQVCRRCGAVQYPPREACHRCLSSALEWRLQAGGAELLSDTTLLHSHDEYFRARLPIRLGLVRLDVGPTAVVYLGDGVGAPPCRVRVATRLDKSGQGVLVAGSDPVRDGGGFRSALLREMSCDPRGRRVLVADAGSALGVALVRALVDAGAVVVWAGCRPAATELGVFAGVEPVRIVSMDPMSDASVNALAAQIGSQVDILIDNTGFLAKAFGPVMRAAAAMAPVGSPICAWVNVIGAASEPAAHSYAQSLRAEMRPAGVRVLNVFARPPNDGSNRAPPPPDLAPAALARAVVKALQDGIEDVYPGELPQDWFSRWCNNPGMAAEPGSATDR